MKILLGAPTGRAAKRMSEQSSIEAKTLHRLLEIDPTHEGFEPASGINLTSAVIRAQ